MLLFGRGKFLANQSHYPDLGSVALSVCNFCNCLSDIINFYEEASCGVAKCWAVFSGNRVGALRENILPAGRPFSNVLAEEIFIVLSFMMLYESSELQEIKDSVTKCTNIL